MSCSLRQFLAERAVVFCNRAEEMGKEEVGGGEAAGLPKRQSFIKMLPLAVQVSILLAMEVASKSLQT